MPPRLESSVQLGRRGAVAFDLLVVLLEGERGGKGERHLAGVAAGHEAAQGHHAFRVYAAAQLGLALDIDDARLADEGARGNPGRVAERMVADGEHRDPVVPRGRGDEARVQELIFRGPRQRALELHLHLEEFGKFSSNAHRR
jgi:hypothetical protein